MQFLYISLDICLLGTVFLSASGGLAVVYILLRMQRTPRWHRRRHLLTVFLSIMPMINYAYYWFKEVTEIELVALIIPTFTLQVLYVAVMCVQTTYFSGFTLPDLCVDWERALSDTCTATAIENVVTGVYMFIASTLMILNQADAFDSFLMGTFSILALACRFWFAYLNFTSRHLDSKRTKLNEEISRAFVRLFHQEEFRSALQQVLALDEIREQLLSLHRRISVVPGTPDEV